LPGGVNAKAQRNQRAGLLQNAPLRPITGSGLYVGHQPKHRSAAKRYTAAKLIGRPVPNGQSGNPQWPIAKALYALFGGGR